MWLSEYVTGRSFHNDTAASGKIRSAGNGSVSVSATQDYHTVPIVAPAGVAYVPAAGAATVVVPHEDGAVCLGVMDEPPVALQAGELLLYSAGGASILLKNDGSVLINGKAVS